MNDTPNRRKDDARPAVALQWGERPDQWTLLLTGPTAGVIGPLGSTWPNHPAELERVDVCVRRKDGPAVVYRTGGEGATTWHQFYPCSSAEPLRDGEYLFREGATLKPEFTHLMMLAAERAGVSFSAQQKCWRAWFDTREPRQPPTLDSSEQYRLQMAAIGTASLGYWKEGDSIHPDYDTVPLRDVARLFAKYDQLYKFREQVRVMVAMLKNREWAEDLAATGDAAELQGVITELVGGLQPLDQDAERAAVEAWANENQTRGPSMDDVWCIYLHGKDAGRRPRDARTAVAAPDAVDAALVDAITHGTGAFQVKADGSTEHVELSKEVQRHYAELAAFPPKLQRDALYQDYAVPKQEGDGQGAT